MAELAWADRERPSPSGRALRVTLLPRQMRAATVHTIGRTPDLPAISGLHASELPSGGVPIRERLEPNDRGLAIPGDVRIHTDSYAGDLNRRLGSRAFTAGEHIYFGAGEFAPWLPSGRALIAHELMHASQQAGHPLHGTLPVGEADDRYEAQATRTAEGPAATPLHTPSARIQRYKSFEHVQAGAAEKYIGPAHREYKVKKGDTPKTIAEANHVEIRDLLALNREKLRKWTDAKGHKLTGFLLGDTILIPIPGKLEVREPKPGEPLRPQRQVTIAGETLDYGEAIAMGDFYADPNTLLHADPAQIKQLRALMKKEGLAPASVGQADWDAATNQRYMQLARQNIAHFAPPDPSLIPHTVAGVQNHRTAYEQWHRAAIQAAMKGDLNTAMATNAFADHFLTDAFAAGHLVNKEDVMGLVTGALSTDAQIEAFAGRVATETWSNPAVRALVSQYKGKKGPFWFQIDSADRLGAVLSGVAEDPAGRDLLPNAVAGAVHDRLNREGVDVENHMHSSWKVGGDGTLEPKGLAIMQRAVAQSQIQVLNAQGEKTEPPTSTYDDVWRYTPRPTATGAKAIRQAVTDLTNVSSTTTARAVAGLVSENLPFLLSELVTRGRMKLDPASQPAASQPAATQPAASQPTPPR